MGPAGGKRPRADAAENREAIVAAASVAFAESSTASLNSIAKRAGVANATLYRHFPTRESLILEVYREEVRHVVDAADQLLAERAPADALREWVERLAQYAITKHGLSDGLRAATNTDQPLFAETYSQIVGALARLLHAAEAVGDVRPGLDADEVILALAGLWQIESSVDWKSRADRLFELVFNGLRA